MDVFQKRSGAWHRRCEHRNKLGSCESAKLREQDPTRRDEHRIDAALLRGAVDLPGILLLDYRVITRSFYDISGRYLLVGCSDSEISSYGL